MEMLGVPSALLHQAPLKLDPALGTSHTILQKCKFLSKKILCNLIHTNCVLMLVYGLDSLFFTRTQVAKMSVVFNNIFRRIFVCL